MKKIFILILTICLFIASVVPVLAKENYDDEIYNYNYKTKRILREYYDEDGILLYSIRLNCYFRYSEGYNQAKCLGVDHEVLYADERVKAKVVGQLQNMRSDLAGGNFKLKIKFKHHLSKKIKIQVFMDSHGIIDIEDSDKDHIILSKESCV